MSFITVNIVSAHGMRHYNEWVYFMPIAPLGTQRKFEAKNLSDHFRVFFPGTLS